MRLFDKFWHQTLRRPYRLAKPLDVGAGQPVIFLHGVGKTGHTWQHVVARLAHRPYRLVAFDLLGFGASPKPAWILYDIDDHAGTVIAAIEKINDKRPVILVGHSLGALVALRIARRRPDLVRHLVLYEMPLYEGLPEKRRYRLRLSLYFRFYRWVLGYRPEFNEANRRRAERLMRRLTGFDVDEASWQPFIKSLEHSIMQQTAADDIQRVKMPMDVIYGRYDMVVIRGQVRQVFGEDAEHVAAHTVPARHSISERASRFIAERIEAAMAQPPEALGDGR
ncbi:MAG TPA: alpha/beta hydrolase [Candidatus Saccharimonadales bacterium]|nr:alpha/beta hydrolase [Candidatus Saccharimonadales bacterium]